MIVLLQRVRSAHVEIASDGRSSPAAHVGPCRRIGPGLVALVCAERGDDDACVARALERIVKLRIFADEAGRMNRSLLDVRGGLLIVSQFTLAAQLNSGHRPSFSAAEAPERARALYDALIAAARATCAQHGLPELACGEFGADMQVHLINDGPVTIPLRISPHSARPDAPGHPR